MSAKKTVKAKAPSAKAKKAPKTTGAATAKKAKPQKAAKASAEAKPKKLSAIDAAVKVLGENGQAMTCKQVIEAMEAKGYWRSPGGKTPDATLYSAILREIQKKGKESRFKKTDRGHFALAGAKG
jgi:vancomycin resistance protein YoaR